MSAYIVDPKHINYLVSAITKYDRHQSVTRGLDIDAYNPTLIGSVLLAENITSVRDRYPNVKIDDLPGPCPTPSAIDYRYKSVRLDTITPVQTLKALDCYEYQSCEHAAWRDSAAFTMCQRLRDTVIFNLPGYDEAEWEITETVSAFA